MVGQNSINKGNLIQKEKDKIYRRDKGKLNFFPIILLYFAGGFLVLCVLLNYWYSLFYNWWGAIFALLAAIFMFVFGRLLYRSRKQRTQIEVYENGFIPNGRPYKYIKNNEELFVYWHEVIDLKRKNFLGNPDKWFYTVRFQSKHFENVRGIIFGYTLFDDEGLKVRDKLEVVEQSLIDKGVDIGKFWTPP